MHTSVRVLFLQRECDLELVYVKPRMNDTEFVCESNFYHIAFDVLRSHGSAHPMINVTYNFIA